MNSTVEMSDDKGDGNKLVHAQATVDPVDLAAKVDNAAAQCFADYRVDCGFSGISSNQCTGYGCCYMKVSSLVLHIACAVHRFGGYQQSN